MLPLLWGNAERKKERIRNFRWGEGWFNGKILKQIGFQLRLESKTEQTFLCSGMEFSWLESQKEQLCAVERSSRQDGCLNGGACCIMHMFMYIVCAEKQWHRQSLIQLWVDLRVLAEEWKTKHESFVLILNQPCDTHIYIFFYNILFWSCGPYPIFMGCKNDHLYLFIDVVT